MSDSVALVIVERVVRRVRNKVQVSDKLVERLVRRGISEEEARGAVIASAVKMALKLTHNDEEAAVTALVVVNGQQNRLPQCAKLLRKHDSAIVTAAYAVKDDLAIANVSLRTLCDFMEFTDADLEGEAAQLRDLLEEIAMCAFSKGQEWALHHRIRKELQEGRLVEAIVEDVLVEIARIDDEYEEMRQARSDAYRKLSL